MRNGKPRFALQGDLVLNEFKAADVMLDNLTLCDSITILQNEDLIDDQLFLDMHALRHLRNRVVHSRSPFLCDHNPPSGLSREETREIVRLALSDQELPLKFRQYTFAIKIDNRTIDYVVDQERLKIDVDKIDPQRNMSVISLALLFAAMRGINCKMPINSA